jgi:hypothetical protein
LFIYSYTCMCMYVCMRMRNQSLYF